ncbi:hypothetical protein XENTR_v10023895 [Xenopus tropicalis]|nr:hypothetical protein XENTR_v10023895 [Xenopus tropicalis]
MRRLQWRRRINSIGSQCAQSIGDLGLVYHTAFIMVINREGHRHFSSHQSLSLRVLSMPSCQIWLKRRSAKLLQPQSHGVASKPSTEYCSHVIRFGHSVGLPVVNLATLVVSLTSN